MNETKINPCVYCGTATTYDLFCEFVRCPNCGARGPWLSVSGKDEFECQRYAVAAWNAPGDRIAALEAQRDELIAVLEMAAQSFREYEAIHRRKMTPESFVKADANREKFRICAAALANVKGIDETN
jgi:hypothetical protein